MKEIGMLFDRVMEVKRRDETLTTRLSDSVKLTSAVKALRAF
jgi:hypothetical protein